MTKFDKSGEYKNKGKLPVSKLSYSIELKPEEINNITSFGN